MKHMVLSMALLCLAGCGIESAGTAATAASLKAKELQQAQAAQAQFVKQLDEVQRQADQRLKDAEGK